MFKTIVLALDGSEGSRRAIPLAVELARRDEARILIAHVEKDLAAKGGPAHAIEAIADEAEADLIVLGTRGHSPVAGLLLGGVTQRLLHIASRPVLALPPAAASEC